MFPLVNTSPPSIARGGISTHADLRPPELESGALDHSATRASILINSGKKKKRNHRHTETSSHFMSLSSPSNGTVFVPQTLQCPKCQITIVPFLRHHSGLMSDDTSLHIFLLDFRSSLCYSPLRELDERQASSYMCI